MILTKKYVFLRTATIKMGKRHFTVVIAMVANRKKNASLGNSMLNHKGHFSLTSWIFLRFLPVVGTIEIRKS